MNLRDEHLQRNCPTVMVPHYEQLPDLDRDGHRFLAARNGLWVELHRHWLHARLPLAAPSIALPYGVLSEALTFRFGPEFVRHLQRFAAESAAAFPNEHAAWLVWNEAAKTLEYEAVDILFQSDSKVHYSRPTYRRGIVPCVDLHSHGRHEAHFSDRDDEDDQGETKLAVCFGNCDWQRQSVAARLSLQGYHYDLSDWVTSVLYND